MARTATDSAARPTPASTPRPTSAAHRVGPPRDARIWYYLGRPNAVGRSSAELVSAPTLDPVIPAGQPRRTGLAKWIRRLAIPIIVGWLTLIAVLNVIVPQLEVVGQMRSVSMSPREAPSVIAMTRVGKVFEEFDSDSSAMIVLEGEQPLGDDAHRFYDEMIKKLKAVIAGIRSPATSRSAAQRNWVSAVIVVWFPVRAATSSARWAKTMIRIAARRSRG
jgi:hypothetical protein